MSDKIKRADVKVGGVYVMKVSGRLTRVRIVEDRGENQRWTPHGYRYSHAGWVGENVATGRKVSVHTAQKLRGLASLRCGKCPACRVMIDSKAVAKKWLIESVGEFPIGSEERKAKWAEMQEAHKALAAVNPCEKPL